MIEVPFNIPHHVDVSMEYIGEVVKSGRYSGNQIQSKVVQEMLSEIHAGAKVVLTNSCTDALKMVSIICDFGPGDEVVMPSFNFTSSALAVVNYGATPVFVDIAKENLCADIARIQDAITHRTKAVIVVNYAGQASNLFRLRQICRDSGVFLIEDNAHGLGGTLDGKTLGTFGDFSTLSFHETKNLQCGEGGALVINNEYFWEKALRVRDKGTDREQFLAGNVDKYTWRDKGGSFLMSELCAAYLRGQVEHLVEINRKRQSDWNRYFFGLNEISSDFAIKPMTLNPSIGITGHIFYLLTDSRDERNLLASKLKKRGIAAYSHYQPLHNSPYKLSVTKSMDCTLTEEISSRLLRLPMFYSIEAKQIQYVIDSLRESLYEIQI